MNSIFHRVSIRKFQDKPVEPEKIESLLRAAMAAPSARNQQPWEFYVVTDKEKIGLLSQTTPYAGCAAGAPVVIIPVYRTESLPAPSMILIDMGLSLENIWLETDALGLGGVCIGISPVPEFMEPVCRILQLPDNLKPFCLFPLGYPSEERPQHDRFELNRIHFVE